MTHKFLSLLLMVSVVFAVSAKNDKLSVSSPDGNISVKIDLDKQGRVYYSVTDGTTQILNRSRLGLKLKDAPDMTEGFLVASTSKDSHAETWQPVWGEEAQIENNYNELRVNLVQKKTAPGRQISLVFRVFNDGIGFRYEFPRSKALGDFVIDDEITEFAFPANHNCWSIPYETNFYEGVFTEKPLDSIGWASTPVTITTANGHVMALHEANLTDYAAMNVEATPGNSTLHAKLTPWSTGEKVFVTDTRVSPWRTLIITRSAGDLALSRLMLNLNEPCAIEDTSWIKPMRYIGIWWDMHMGNNTWYDGPKHGATTENTKRYIDFAAANGFDGVLVEGWNPDWRTSDFSFTRSYDDFDLKAVNDYARDKGIAFIGHHETSGHIKNYDDQLEDALRLYADNGMHYVKTGYAGTPFDGNERHSGQYAVRHYRRVIERAAANRIAVDNHEPVMPTGLQRTWPNLMTQEGVRGQEWDAWDEKGGNPPAHTVTLPFTRGLAGPMDFTPGTFKFENPRHPQTVVHTTLAKQLALFVILYSPLQMASDIIENYQANPGPFRFLADCPTDWDRTVYPEAEIGKFVTVARKEKGGDSWFIGSATGDDARTATVALDFLDPGCQYLATIYRDGPAADHATNPTQIIIEQKKVDNGTVLSIPQARSGGAAIKIAKIK